MVAPALQVEILTVAAAAPALQVERLVTLTHLWGGGPPS
jgi:hypothetical protein